MTLVSRVREITLSEELKVHKWIRCGPAYLDTMFRGLKHDCEVVPVFGEILANGGSLVHLDRNVITHDPSAGIISIPIPALEKHAFKYLGLDSSSYKKGFHCFLRREDACRFNSKNKKGKGWEIVGEEFKILPYLIPKGTTVLLGKQELCDGDTALVVVTPTLKNPRLISKTIIEEVKGGEVQTSKREGRYPRNTEHELASSTVAQPVWN